MKLKSLEINNYKMFKNCHFKFNERVNVIIGENGTGKTTLLELIYKFLASDSSELPSVMYVQESVEPYLRKYSIELKLESEELDYLNTVDIGNGRNNSSSLTLSIKDDNSSFSMTITF